MSKQYFTVGMNLWLEIGRVYYAWYLHTVFLLRSMYCKKALSTVLYSHNQVHLWSCVKKKIAGILDSWQQSLSTWIIKNSKQILVTSETVLSIPYIFLYLLLMRPKSFTFQKCIINGTMETVECLQCHNNLVSTYVTCSGETDNKWERQVSH